MPHRRIVHVALPHLALALRYSL